jgi:carbon-monoxide dehydrogenase medium subunit
MVALGAEFVIAGQDGERVVSAADFFIGVYMTAAGLGDVLTKIRIPAGRSDGFAAITIGADGTCIVNAAASLNGEARIAIGCVDAVPILIRPTSTDDDAVRESVRGAELDPPSDVHASGEYRRHLAEVVAIRALRQAAEKR